MLRGCEIAFVIVLCGLGVVAEGGLTLGGVSCGQKKCQQWEYCSKFDKTCQPCKDACDVTSHNYEKSLCEEDCQDYLHDQRYVRVDGGSGKGDENLRSTVEQLSRMVTITLTLVCLMLLVLASVLGFQLYRWKIKKNITFASLKNKLLRKKVQEEPNPSKNDIHNSEPKKNDLRLEMPTTVTRSEHSPITTTTSISRRPAEDSTLDYAYDNPVMTSGSK